MKIKDIYKSKNFCFVSVIAAALCIIVTLVTRYDPETYESLAYAYPLKYPWQILSGIFVHGSPSFETHETIGHLGFNLLLVLPFGIMIEKMIGSRKFSIFFISLWIVNAITFYTMAIINTPSGECTFGAGISGIAFAFGAVGLYILWSLFKKDKKALFKQVSFYLLLNIAVIMMIMINPFVAGVQSMIMHAVSVLCGVIFLLLRHKDIDEFLEN